MHSCRLGGSFVVIPSLTVVCCSPLLLLRRQVNLRHASSSAFDTGASLDPSPLSYASKPTSVELLPGAGAGASDDSRGASQL